MDRPTSPRTVVPVSADRVSADGAGSEEEMERAGDGAVESRRTVVAPP